MCASGLDIDLLMKVRSYNIAQVGGSTTEEITEDSTKAKEVLVETQDEDSTLVNKDSASNTQTNSTSTATTGRFSLRSRIKSAIASMFSGSSDGTSGSSGTGGTTGSGSTGGTGDTGSTGGTGDTTGSGGTTTETPQTDLDKVNINMSLANFMSNLNLDSNSNTISATEIINAYNQTKDDELKAILKYLVNTDDAGVAQSVNESYKLIASYGNFDYQDAHLNNYGIELYDLQQWVGTSGITRNSLETLKDETYWYDLAGTKNKSGSTAFNYSASTINNVPTWFAESAASLYNSDGSPDLYAFRLLSGGNGVSGWGLYESYSNYNLAKYNISSSEDFNNKDKFDALSYAADLVQKTDNADGYENGVCSTDNILNLYNSIKDSDTQEAKDLKATLSVYIDENNGVAKIKDEYKYKTIYANDLFDAALSATNYYNIK